ncbi:MAG: FliH/SctL family protein [Candidatus Margulisbacteria bacterium]|nr:FliH/SctL family protein [Candidatus Margulisiibacteriota bacterium]
MGLIKRDQIEEKGTLIVDRKIQLAPLKKPTIKAVIPPPSSKSQPPKATAGPAVPTATEIPKAKSEAQKIIDNALKEAEAIREEARQAGREEGRSESSARIEEALETLNQAVKERKNIIKDSEAEILRLAIKVAEQIIRSEVSLHRDVSLNIVAEAISRISDREQIIVRVNREDAEYIKRYKDRIAGIMDGVKSFSILEDANIEPGGCIIETNLGFIDAKISTKLKSIEEALKKVYTENDNQ